MDGSDSNSTRGNTVILVASRSFNYEDEEICSTNKERQGPVIDLTAEETMEEGFVVASHKKPPQKSP